MQNPSAEKDEEHMRNINARISGQEASSMQGLGSLDQQQLLSMLTRECSFFHFFSPVMLLSSIGWRSVGAHSYMLTLRLAIFT